MPRRLAHLSCLLIVAAAASLLVAATPASAAPGRYVVVLHAGASPTDAAKRHGAAPSHVYRTALRGYAAHLSDAALARIQRDPAVRFVTLDRVVSLGKPGGGGGDVIVPGQVTPTGITRIGQLATRYDGQANDGLDGTGGINVDVAVIDTGIDGKHPDLLVAGGFNCSSGTSWADGNGHGSHVAGTIGARDNAIGVVGVVPGARLHAVRVLDNRGSGTWSSVACGLDWVASNAATIEVANLSLGGTGTDNDCRGTNTDVLHVAICGVTDAGVTVVVAAGNNHLDASNYTPATYEEVITVSAWADFNGFATGDLTGTPCRTDEEESLANFSNFGADVDISAPGVCIRSTWKGGGYNTISGTSMASPHVAGAAALYLSSTTHAGESPSQVLAALQANRELVVAADDPDTIDEGLLSIIGW